MKLVISLAALLVSASALAMPAVGDYSQLKLTISHNGTVTNGTLELGLTEKDADGNFKLKTVTTIEGQPQAEEGLVAAADFLNDEAVTEIMANCEMFGGELATYTATDISVPVCVIPQQSGEIQIGAVPFGIAKRTMVDAATGRTVTLELQKYTLGK